MNNKKKFINKLFNDTKNYEDKVAVLRYLAKKDKNNFSSAIKHSLKKK
mgnify:CR=1 FL=1